jgi:spore maturation protein CgeB
MLIGLCNTVGNKFTHVIFIDGLSIQPWVIGSIKQKTILISTEDPHSNDLTHLMYPMYDYSFSNDLNSAKAFGAYYLPTAFDSFNVVDGDNSVDLLFIGAIYENRLPVLEQFYEICKSKDLTFKIVGPKHYKGNSVIDEIVEEEIISTEEMIKMIANSKLCLNIFRETLECSLSKNKTFGIEPYDMNPRCFDAIGVGSLLITDYRDSVKEVFSSEIIYKNNNKEGIIKDFIENEPSRNDLLNRLNNKLINKHTYLNRCATIISVIEKGFF